MGDSWGIRLRPCKVDFKRKPNTSCQYFPFVLVCSTSVGKKLGLKNPASYGLFWEPNIRTLQISLTWKTMVKHHVQYSIQVCRIQGFNLSFGAIERRHAPFLKSQVLIRDESHVQGAEQTAGPLVADLPKLCFGFKGPTGTTSCPLWPVYAFPLISMLQSTHWVYDQYWPWEKSQFVIPGRWQFDGTTPTEVENSTAPLMTFHLFRVQSDAGSVPRKMGVSIKKPQ